QNHGSGIEPEKYPGYCQGNTEKCQYIAGTIGDIASGFRKPDYANIDIVTFKAAANLFFKVIRYLSIIQRRSGGRVALDQFGPDQGPGKIIGYQVADTSGFDDVVSNDRHPFFSGLKLSGNDI